MTYSKVDSNTYKFKDFPVVVSFLKKDDYNTNTKVIEHNVKDSQKTYKIMSWGDNNDLVDTRENLISDNNIVPQLLQTKRNIIMGSEIFTFRYEYDEKGKRKVVEIPTPDNIKEVLDELEEEDYWEELSNDFIKNAMSYVRFLKLKNGEYKISTIRARYIRPEEMDAFGVINNYYRSGNWKKQTGKPIEVVQIPSYQAIKSSKEYPEQFIHRISDNFIGNEYFPTPVWWTGSKWIEIGNKIPEFHTFNLENQYFTPLHIEIPKDYFYNGYAVKQQKITETEAREQEAEKRKTFLEKVDEVLSGTKNAGKAVWSEYSISNLQKEYGGIRFNELQIPRGDEALLKLFEKTNEANISGTGVHPSLAAIMTDSALSNGSEIRSALYMYIITQALLPRKQLLKPLYILSKLNKWDKSIRFGFRDVELTTTDKNPTGQQAVTTN